jgi:hypothetical protein
MATPNVTVFEALSGPPPVLRTEESTLYDQIRAHFMS